MFAYAGIISLYFVAWTFYSYWLHRIAHIRHRYNLFYYLHIGHHLIRYDQPVQRYWPHWTHFFLWFENWRNTFDALVDAAPVIILAIFQPHYGIPLLVFHYLYESVCSEHLIDHNPNISGRITRYFAWGKFHLQHHKSLNNYGFYFTVWDRIFGTADFSYLQDKTKAPQSVIQTIQEKRKRRHQMSFS